MYGLDLKNCLVTIHKVLVVVPFWSYLGLICPNIKTTICIGKSITFMHFLTCHTLLRNGHGIEAKLELLLGKPLKIEIGYILSQVFSAMNFSTFQSLRNIPNADFR